MTRAKPVGIVRSAERIGIWILRFVPLTHTSEPLLPAPGVMRVAVTVTAGGGGRAVSHVTPIKLNGQMQTPSLHWPPFLHAGEHVEAASTASKRPSSALELAATISSWRVRPD
jgi:hypothetical protein